MDIAALDAAIDEPELIEFTRDLVRTHSLTEAGRGERAVADFLLTKIREWGWQPEFFDADGRPNIAVTLSGGGGPGPTLAFEGHMDVVTEGDPGQWTVDPYGGEIRDGKLYGRGSADMKSGVAAMLYGTRALQLTGPFPGRIRLLLLADEEGMMSGAKAAVAQGFVRDVDGVVCCEPEGDEVCPVSKGAIRLRVDFTGVMSHGAMPWQGRNTLPAMARAVLGLEALEHRLVQEAGSRPPLGAPSITPTVVRAGTADQLNTISGVSSMFLDVRTIPGVDHETLLKNIGECVDNAARGCGIGSAVTVIDDRPWISTDPDAPLVTALVRAHEIVNGVRPELGAVPGTTDGTILTCRANIPSVVYGPGGKWIAHMADEYVEVRDLKRYALTYAVAAQDFLRGGAVS
ncbi:M20 family metallopeptidase [Nocardia brasiliensis]|uniref:Probable succinyl-diaminopimelate desuccinylase n=1 Tax=Nocardia brasiliensis (strain ATCC 700358 / HUJEG-1) TaxID=1133849 RepID=K0ER15_NOCB7|nr:M20 family metallopeptidase [Nocardia brasiliensis]AFU02233.1 acetylornithine deacetylase or succinyl-diaminopimelate desuccinylase [Nocardia brasiliensis ATCC 700358]